MKLNFKNSNATVILMTEQEKQHGFAFSGKKWDKYKKQPHHKIIGTNKHGIPIEAKI